MIARIEFIGIVLAHGKRKGLRDHVDLHVGSLREAEPMLKNWITAGRNGALRGNSGIFHPLGRNGEIQIKSVKEAEE